MPRGHLKEPVQRVCKRCSVSFLALTTRQELCGDVCADASRRDIVNRAARNWKLREWYSIDQAEYDRLLREQNFACKICAASQADEYHKKLAVDHDHETGIVRGLLCSRCNRGLGMFRDNPDFLSRAAAYLRKTLG